MRALVKAKAEEGLWLEDVPEPEVGVNDVLIRVHRTGIRGTDLHKVADARFRLIATDGVFSMDGYLARLDARPYLEQLVELGVYAVSFSYPVVRRGTARIRTQVSAAHTRDDLEFAAARFADARDAVAA